jgi:hypothetical protein
MADSGRLKRQLIQVFAGSTDISGMNVAVNSRGTEWIAPACKGCDRPARKS